MSHSRSSKFSVDSYRNFRYDNSKTFKLAKALKGKQKVKVLTYFKNHCKGSQCGIHNLSENGKPAKKKKKKNLCKARFYSRSSKLSISKKLAKALKGKHTLKLLTYYRTLCRSTKCGIHNSPDIGKLTKENKTKVNDVLSTGDDSEEIPLETIDINMYKKIASSVEDVDITAESFISSIVGYSEIRDILNKTVIWPLKKPETFKGLRAAPRGILLFGPPGTGKTSLVRLIAFETNSTFFNVSASTLSSKWMGESEKLVRVLFLVAKARQPSIIFIDEIHGLLSEKTKDEDESTKRLKNEFLFCMSLLEILGFGLEPTPMVHPAKQKIYFCHKPLKLDFLSHHWGGSSGAQQSQISQSSIDSVKKNRIVVIGSTSRPQEIDERVRPKFAKRIYIPLPNENDRKEILLKLLERECHSMETSDIKEIADKTEGFSIVDLRNLCQEAAMRSIRALPGNAIYNLKPNRIRPISADDFENALRIIKPTVSEDQVKACEYWDILYGYGGRENIQ